MVDIAGYLAWSQIDTSLTPWLIHPVTDFSDDVEPLNAAVREALREYSAALSEHGYTLSGTEEANVLMTCLKKAGVGLTLDGGLTPSDVLAARSVVTWHKSLSWWGRRKVEPLDAETYRRAELDPWQFSRAEDLP